ncbi:MAG TPA: 4-carboxymuconolactone decarboxylase [Acidimicrobiia bacterium]|nr:4-carboxymuconolactone decarboxylase [Acidimicrobiia bacterium]
MSSERHDEGMRVRREVLGDEHVDAAIAATTGIDRDFQRWITENVWGDLWTRQTLSRRDRSLVTIAILAAMGHEELALHLRAARNTGATADEIADLLQHVAVYAGVPAANQAFKTMKTIYDEEE